MIKELNIGKTATLKNIAENLKKLGYVDEMIHQVTGLSIAEIKFL